MNLQEPLRHTFHKSERLRHKTLVDHLFAGGKSLYAPPLRLVWREMTAAELEGAFRHGVPDKVAPVQMMVTVPKKKLRRAVWRVGIRRRIREAYRLRKGALRRLQERPGASRLLMLSFIYQSNEIVPSEVINQSMDKLLTKLTTRICDASSPSC